MGRNCTHPAHWTTNTSAGTEEMRYGLDGLAFWADWYKLAATSCFLEGLVLLLHLLKWRGRHPLRPSGIFYISAKPRAFLGVHNQNFWGPGMQWV